MSAADDVLEMQGICEFIAERLAQSSKDKDRANALFDALNPKGKELFSWNRCFEFLRGRARRIDSWEKDLAREKAEAIRQAERERKHAEHIEWLSHIYETAASRGADVDRGSLAVLQRTLREVGALDSAVGDSFPAEDQDQPINW